MKKTNLLIGAVVSGLVAGSAANLSSAKADHHDKAKAEGKENACKGNSCKGHAADAKDKKAAKKNKKDKKAAEGAPAADAAAAPAAPAETTTPPAGE
jgi:hypothetical protein